jgi:hypothetical protein
MQTVAAILVTAAATVGTVRAVKKLRQVMQRRKGKTESVGDRAASGPVIELEKDQNTGVYSERRGRGL